MSQSLEFAAHRKAGDRGAALLAWVRPLAFAIAAVYPLYWLAQFSLNSLPALLRVVRTGYEVKLVRISVLGSYVLSGAASDPAAPVPGFRSQGAYSVLGVLLALVIGVGVLRLTRRRAAYAAGLFVAILGFTGIEQLFYRLRGESLDMAWASAAFIYFVLWTLGLRRWADEVSPSDAGYGRRFAAALLGFALPLGLLWLVLHFWVGASVMRPIVWLFFPGFLPIAVAARRHPGAGGAGNREIGWRWACTGAGATIVMATVLSWGGSAVDSSLRERQAARARAEVASLPVVSPTAPYPGKFFQRGVNFTAEFPAPYASVDALHSLARLPAFGVDSIALVTYGWASQGDPTIHVRPGLGMWESDQGLEDVARLAHSLGMKVLLKPQLWVRGSSPMRIDFSNPAERARWFAQYGDFIDHYARLATHIHAEVLCVGVELAGMSGYGAEWRHVIAGVRQLYPGPLVYAANFGPDFQDVTFWDALDYIGLDEYYPLPPNLSTADLVRRVEKVAVAYRRPVILTEVGFASTVHPELHPWDDSGRTISLLDQQRCYEAIFRAFYEKPWFEGMYWWKVGTNGAGGPRDGSFTPWGKPAMNVVRDWYLHGARSRPGGG